MNEEKLEMPKEYYELERKLNSASKTINELKNNLAKACALLREYDDFIKSEYSAARVLGTEAGNWLASKGY